eukprot:GFYU01009706.1.p1 GENE.GFYU01009706.1~~GFYU01009706.1.p1  ORF type:complete len:105 (-),score=14.91 GFYU01009706.1:187-501(-)
MLTAREGLLVPPPRQRSRLAFVGLVFLGLFLAYTIVIGFVFGSRHYEHILLTLLLLAILFSLATLVSWYSHGDLDPKFKYMIIFNGVTLLYGCAVANAYIWNSA